MAEQETTWPRLEPYRSTLGEDGAVAWLEGLKEAASGGGEVRVVTHAKPDGDAFGSVVAVVGTLRAIGVAARGYVVPPVPPGIEQLPGQEMVTVLADEAAVTELAATAGGSTVIVDTGAWSQLGALAEVVAGGLERTLLIDHHLSGDVPAGERLIDTGAAACCEVLWPIVRRLLDGAGVAMPEAVRDGLYAGLASDTGWFRFSNTRPGTLRAAADLIELGTDHTLLYETLNQSERPEKLKLLRAAIDRLELLFGARVAVMSLRRADFEAAGAREEETERMVDLPQVVATVRVVVLVCERLDGKGCKLSFRSKPAPADGSGPEAVNVAAIAGLFGGGGHARAAGAKSGAGLEETLGLLRERLAEFMT
ncbi:DHH family phosphoesterase [Mucisphaera sp.]|uniref:DHH family phosphoesterase n=1 Tax=Mucisphaera sp. TaxID=2913024 RepID=UPI003D0D4680